MFTTGAFVWAESAGVALAKRVAEQAKEKELETKTNDLEDLSNRILGLTKELVPVDANLDLDKLEKKKNQIGFDILHVLSEEKNKKGKLDEYTQNISEISQSIEEHKIINGKPIEDAKKEWDEYKSEINETEHQIQLLEQSLGSNREKLSHLEKHEYDPNCKFCMNNVFVKDALETKSKVEEQEDKLSELGNKHQSENIGEAQ